MSSSSYRYIVLFAYGNMMVGGKIYNILKNIHGEFIKILAKDIILEGFDILSINQNPVAIVGNSESKIVVDVLLIEKSIYKTIKKDKNLSSYDKIVISYNGMKGIMYYLKDKSKINSKSLLNNKDENLANHIKNLIT